MKKVLNDKNQKGLGLIGVLLIIAVLLLTAGGVVVWEKKIRLSPSPTPIFVEPPPVTSPQPVICQTCEPMDDIACSDIYDPRWYYSVEKMECYQPQSRCEGSSFATKEECEQCCSTTTKPILDGTWKLVAYKNLITGGVESEPEKVGRSIIIELKDNGRIGTIKGHTVTNTLGPGRYELLENHRIKILKLATTLVFEPNWGVKFYNAIHRSSSYQIKGNSLLLYFNNDKELVEFVRQ